jgi:2-polyprenyl-6-methoxyphenol hydroxylase-like FAD-dependent oxidoreductase
MEVIIVGAGIGGLSLALSLHQAGIGVRVYEAVAELSPLGVGINLQPTAVRELTELGLGSELAEIGISTRQLSYFNKFGQLVWREPRGISAGYKWPQYSIHRGQLQMLLLRAARERIGSSNVRSGQRFVNLREKGARVTATFCDSFGATAVDEADVLVGADGIHSAVRFHLHPLEGEPRFAQQIMWRAAVEAEPFLGGDTMIIAGHFHQRIIVYPIGRAQGGCLLTNWICQKSVTGPAPGREDWNRQTSPEEVLNEFGNWQFPWLDLPELIAHTAQIYEFPLVDRDPIETWTRDRVTLIGDAAHPMHPIGSQAGSQAILDARTLTAALVRVADPVEALLHYDCERRPRMNDITLRNREFGPEAALQLVEERAPHGFTRIEEVVSQRDLEVIASTFAQAAGLDPATVNGRPPFVPDPIRG